MASSPPHLKVEESLYARPQKFSDEPIGVEVGPGDVLHASAQKALS